MLFYVIFIQLSLPKELCDSQVANIAWI